MTKQDLVNSVSAKTRVSPQVTEMVINQTMVETKRTLANGESIFLRGFGTWIPKIRKAKLARDISRGTTIKVPAKKIPYFKPSKEFKDLLK
jgi:nucleoid DNA-binding protein